MTPTRGLSLRTTIDALAVGAQTSAEATTTVEAGETTAVEADETTAAPAWSTGDRW